MRKSVRVLSSMLLVGLFVASYGCETAPKTEAGKEDLHDDVVATLNKFKRQDASLERVLNNVAGYVMFPSVGKGGLIAGAAYGKGEAFEHGLSIGWADLRQGSIGAQIGGQEYAELVIFKTQDALDRFKNNNFTFGANASAVAVKSGAASGSEFKDGVAVITMHKGGLMADASLTGQQVTFRPR